MIRTLVGILVLLIIYLGTVCGCLFCITPLLVILPISPKWCMRLASVIVGTWMCYAVTWVQAVCGVTIRVFGDQLQSSDRQTLMLFNHRTRLDYAYFWAYLGSRRMLTDHKIVLKHELNLIPGAGTAMQSGSFVFLRRTWQQDHRALERYLYFYNKAQINTKLLIFPEGTDLRPDSIASSNRFAENQGLPPYEYVLHPRTTGFVYILNSMRNTRRLDSIADVTVGYAVNVPRSEADLLAGRWPRVVDFFITSYPTPAMPFSDEDLADWLKLRWQEKENFLRWYYTVRSEEQRVQESVVRYAEQNKEYRLIFQTSYTWHNLLLTAAMSLVTICGCTLFYMNYYALVCGLVLLALQLLLTLFLGGIDKLMINYNWWLCGQQSRLA